MFEDRAEAGRLLARKLLPYKKNKKTVVLGVPRGGVVTAKVVARSLKLPLDVVITRKIGAPQHEELAIGAVGLRGIVVLDKDYIQRSEIEKEYIEKGIKDRQRQIKQRLRRFRSGKKSIPLKGRSAILVDDGIATGATVEASVKYLRKVGVKDIILAVPVAPPDTIKKLKKLVDKVIVLEKPSYFRAVGQFYRNFPQVSDKEVIQLLQ